MNYSIQKTACVDPPEIPNCDIVSKRKTISHYYYPDTFEYICKPGFIPENKMKTYYCTVSGNWLPKIDENNIKCKEIPQWCPIITIENGDVNYSKGQQYDSVASFECDFGFKLNKIETRLCQADRRWSGSESLCDPIICPPMELDVEIRAKIKENFYHIIACGSKDVTVVCQKNNRWQYIYPYCDKISNDNSQSQPISNNNSNDKSISNNDSNKNKTKSVVSKPLFPKNKITTTNAYNFYSLVNIIVIFILVVLYFIIIQHLK